MYRIKIYMPVDGYVENYKSLEEIAKDVQLLQKPIKEGFYKDVSGNLIEIIKEDI
ncbi:hypothetical protein [Thermoanaerobacterium thermosaccharolyticum]|uniref:hypothetical protein n=1 Tax=Thermoanaerobacterium thermosaccharolyticum TaxID=1517 RepID=UPI00177DA083|nr:hypothetical protein [Thermoanaerobacterium thermosaccharolyticum]